MEQIRSSSPTPPSCPRGGGTGGSRSLQIGGRAVLRARRGGAGAGKALAADAARGRARGHRRDRRRSGSAWPACRRRRCPGRAGAAAARRRRRAAARRGRLRPGGRDVPVRRPRGGGRGRHRRPARSSPVRHVAVDDCGRILNPLIVAGPAARRLAQGMAQALWEEFVYDDDGNPITATLADYAMPSAAELPPLRDGEHRDADAAQPARREGHRRVGHDRRPRRRCRTPWSTR